MAEPKNPGHVTELSSESGVSPSRVPLAIEALDRFDSSRHLAG
jgi:hypothetical protein